jgi:serine/threonine protein kinase
MGYKEYSIGVDCWAIGCIFAQLVNGKSLLQGSSDAEQLILIFKLFGTPDLQSWPDLEKYKGYSMQFPKFSKIGLENKINRRLDS